MLKLVTALPLAAFLAFGAAPAIAQSAGGGPAVAPSALTNANVIREVQAQLYNLNYQINVVDGRMNDETRQAIRSWQERLKLTVTGDMTEAEVARLKAAKLPTAWGALAYNARGAYGVAWSRPSRALAEQAALEECKKNSKTGPCKLITAANSGCGALGFYNSTVKGTQHWGAYASIRSTLGQAIEHASSTCKEKSKNPTACGIRTTFCADGSHKS